MPLKPRLVLLVEPPALVVQHARSKVLPVCALLVAEKGHDGKGGGTSIVKAHSGLSLLVESLSNVIAICSGYSIAASYSTTPDPFSTPLLTGKQGQFLPCLLSPTFH